MYAVSVSVWAQLNASCAAVAWNVLSDKCDIMLSNTIHAVLPG